LTAPGLNPYACDVISCFQSLLSTATLYRYSTAFEFSRQFVYYWSVNFKFVPEEVFLSKPFALGLLTAHLVALLALAHRRWHAHGRGLQSSTV
jgi:alpha-1,3-mannosyltransferase